MERVIWNGDVGERWRNDTGANAYQFLCNWHNTCGVCAQFDRAVSPSRWPLPLHLQCQCAQELVRAGAWARAWVDFRAIIDRLPDEERRRVVGKNALLLIRRGVVAWEDVVTRYRVRSLREVVAIKGLDVKTMLRAGLDPGPARAAYESVHTAAHELLAAQRRRLLADLEGAGLSGDQVRELAAVGLAGRASVVTPGGRGRPAGGRGHEAALKAALAGRRGRKPKAAADPWLEEPTLEAGLDRLLRAGREDPEITTSREMQAVADLVEKHATEGPSGRFHGMDAEESFRTVEYLGYRMHFSGPAAASGVTQTVQRMSVRAVEYRMPARLADATEGIYFTGQANAHDELWRARYKDFAASVATGGDGRIVVYRGSWLTRPMLAHESGHNLSARLWGSETPGFVFTAAAAGEAPVSAYAANSPAEDFAESVAAYVTRREEFRGRCPRRFAVVDRIMTDPDFIRGPAKP